jgi:hypothetical protein
MVVDKILCGLSRLCLQIGPINKPGRYWYIKHHNSAYQETVIYKMYYHTGQLLSNSVDAALISSFVRV